jgi:hypothetical protein
MFGRVLEPHRLIAAVLVLNVGTLGTHVWLSQRADGPRAVARGTQLSRPAGSTAEGRDLTDEDYAGHRCHLLRYESARCTFCQADRAVLDDLLRDARERSCTVTFLAPTPAEQITDRAAQPGLVLSYPALTFVRSFPADATPTTVVADAAWRVAWSKAGILRAPDRIDAWATLR